MCCWKQARYHHDRCAKTELGLPVHIESSPANRINVMILEKALTLELAHFEDAEYYDKLVRPTGGLEQAAEPSR